MTNRILGVTHSLGWARALLLAALPLAMAACGDLPLASPYLNDKPIRAPASVPAFQITALDTFQTASKPGHIWVQPTSGHGLGLAWNGAVPRWVAMRQDVEPAYRGAALAVVGTSCTIDSAMPVPDLMAFDFTFSCPPK